MGRDLKGEGPGRLISADRAFHLCSLHVPGIPGSGVEHAVQPSSEVCAYLLQASILTAVGGREIRHDLLHEFVLTDPAVTVRVSRLKLGRG